MNKVILMGRLCRDPEIRVSSTGANPTTIGRFTLAVDRRFKKEGQPEADFFGCTCFGKTAEFAEKYLHKGTKIVVVGSIQNDNYTNNKGEPVYSVQIIVDEMDFAESKNAQSGSAPQEPATDANGFMNVPDGVVEDLPFA